MSEPTVEASRRWYDFIDLALFAVGLAALVVTAGLNAHTFPLLDDWRYCDYFQGESYWQFVRAPHNEHNLWVFKGLTLWLVELTKWRTQPFVIAGLGIFAAGQTLLFLLIRQKVESRLVRCGAAVFLAMPGAHENLVWSWQTTFHLCLLFGVAALWQLERATTVTAASSRQLGAAGVLGVLALFSVGGGVAWALAIIVGLGLVVLWVPSQRLVAAAVAFGVVACVAYYLHISPHPVHHPPLVLPWKDPVQFGKSWLTGTGLGLSFPFDIEAAFRAGVAGLVVFVIGVGLYVFAKEPLARAVVIVAALAAGLAGPAMVTVSRSAFGPGAVVVSRYFELTVVIALPVFWGLGQLFLRGRLVGRIVAVLVAFAVPANAVRSIPAAVHAMQIQRVQVDRVRTCFRANPGNPACFQGIYPFPEYVAGCVETLHQRWGDWGHLGGD